jgi:hypothetical protein
MFPTLDEALATFDYHKPSDEQVGRIANIRILHKRLLSAIWDQVPAGPDRTCVVRKIHESMMTCNKAIVCEAQVSDGTR